MRLRVGLFACVGVLLAACTSDSSKPVTPRVNVHGALTALIRWEIGQQQGTPTTDAALPVIYVVSADGATYNAEDQAAVVKDTNDDAKVRFADEREDALDVDTDGKPVKDGGVLLVVAPIDTAAGSQVEVTVTEYRSLTDESDWSMVITATATGTTVTSSTRQAPD